MGRPMTSRTSAIPTAETTDKCGNLFKLCLPRVRAPGEYIPHPFRGWGYYSSLSKIISYAREVPHLADADCGNRQRCGLSTTPESRKSTG